MSDGTIGIPDDFDSLQAPEAFLKFVEERKGQPKLSTDAPVPPCQKLIFVAVPTELHALEFAARELGIELLRLRDPEKRLKYFDLGIIGGERILAVQTGMGPHSDNGSAAHALRYRWLTGANTIISLGMAFGTLPRFQRIGTVLVATGVLPYDSARIVLAALKADSTEDHHGNV